MLVILINVIFEILIMNMSTFRKSAKLNELIFSKRPTQNVINHAKVKDLLKCKIDQ